MPTFGKNYETQNTKISAECAERGNPCGVRAKNWKSCVRLFYFRWILLSHQNWKNDRIENILWYDLNGPMCRKNRRVPDIQFYENLAKLGEHKLEQRTSRKNEKK